MRADADAGNVRIGNRWQRCRKLNVDRRWRRRRVRRSMGVALTIDCLSLFGRRRCCRKRFAAQTEEWIPFLGRGLR